MAEKHLDCPEVRAGLEQMGRETMPQSVHRHVLAQAGVLRCPDADFVHGFSGDGLVWDVPGEEPVGRPTDFPVFTEQHEQPRREHYITIPPPFGLSDADDHSLAIEIIDPKADDLGEPQAGGISGHEDGAVLDVDETCEERGDFVRAENDREPLGLLWERNAVQDVFPSKRDLVEVTQRRSVWL